MSNHPSYLLEEIGITYTWSKTVGYLPFYYVRKRFHKSPAEEKIYCKSYKDFAALLKHWNEQSKENFMGWSYTAI